METPRQAAELVTRRRCRLASGALTDALDSSFSSQANVRRAQPSATAPDDKHESGPRSARRSLRHGESRSLSAVGLGYRVSSGGAVRSPRGLATARAGKQAPGFCMWRIRGDLHRVLDELSCLTVGDHRRGRAVALAEQSGCLGAAAGRRSCAAAVVDCRFRRLSRRLCAS